MMLSVVSPPARHLRKPASRTLIESRIRTSGCTGPLLSPPPPPPTWLCVSTRPGMITLPVASIRSASGGMGVVAAGPTARILPPRTTTTPAGMGGPAIGITSAPENATGRSCAEAVRQASRPPTMRQRSVGRGNVTPVIIRGVPRPAQGRGRGAPCGFARRRNATMASPAHARKSWPRVRGSSVPSGSWNDSPGRPAPPQLERPGRCSNRSPKTLHYG